MQLRSVEPADLLTGLIYIAVGAVATGVALTYRLGNASAMGPGYFPVGLGSILIGLGVLISVGSFLPSTIEKAERVPVVRWDCRPSLLILGSVLAFALALPSLGVFISVMILVGLSSLANRPVRWLPTAVSMVLLATASVIIFIWALGLPLAAFPPLLGTTAWSF
jgi:hypothetical protein